MLTGRFTDILTRGQSSRQLVNSWNSQLADSDFGNSTDKLCHPRSVTYSVEHVLLNNYQISGGGTYLHCYCNFFNHGKITLYFYTEPKPYPNPYPIEYLKCSVV